MGCELFAVCPLRIGSDYILELKHLELSPAQAHETGFIPGIESCAGSGKVRSRPKKRRPRGRRSSFDALVTAINAPRTPPPCRLHPPSPDGGGGGGRRRRRWRRWRRRRWFRPQRVHERQADYRRREAFSTTSPMTASREKTGEYLERLQTGAGRQLRDGFSD